MVLFWSSSPSLSQLLMVVLALYHRCAAPCSLIDLIILIFEMKCWERCGRWPFCNILLFKWSPVLPTMDKQWVGPTRSNACQSIVKLIVSSFCVSSLNTSQCCITNIRSLKWTKKVFACTLFKFLDSDTRYLIFPPLFDAMSLAELGESECRTKRFLRFQTGAPEANLLTDAKVAHRINLHWF